jgi:hypothetical protein
MMTWIDILHPIKTIRNIRNEWYERREARIIFDLLEAIERRNDLEVLSELRAEITQPLTERTSRPAGNTYNRDIILRCLYENWPNEVSMIGGNLVTQIVDEVLVGNRPEFRVAGGGFNFDLTPYMDKIHNATILLVSMMQEYTRVRHARSSHNTPNTPDEGNAPDDRTQENVEELISILARYLTEEMTVDRREATRLARMFMRINSGGQV